MVCTPGDYATSPPFTAITVASFSPSNGTYVFEQPLSITNSMNITFGGGTYWFKGGLSVVGDASVSFGTGTYIFGNSASDTCASSTCLSVSNSGSITSGSSQVLLYNEAGAVTLSGAGAVALTGTSADAGVAIWDASAQGTTYPLTLANSASSTAGYGGVFVPNGEVLLSGAAPVSMSFLITEYANVSGSGAFNLG